MLDVTVDQPKGILKGERSAGPQALSFERLVPALDLTVGLRIKRGSPDMSHAGEADEFLEIASDELRTVAPWERLEYSEGVGGAVGLLKGA
jgi:hypothetical protein